MPIYDEMPATKPAPKKRVNKTYRKKLTKKQLKKRKNQILIILIAFLVGAGIISAYSQCTGRYMENTLEVTDIMVPRTHVAEAREIEIVDVSSGTIREVTAYNLGDPNQTDDSPCITANGMDGCKMLEEGIQICAANFVPFGTKLYIDHFGECVVVDRMNSRYKNRVDIGMKLSEKERAIKFGLQNLLVK